MRASFSHLVCHQLGSSKKAICQYFFFYRRQSSTINNSAVIKQFLGQWASGNDIFHIKHLTESWMSHQLTHFRLHWLFHKGDKQTFFVWFDSDMKSFAVAFLHRCFKYTRYTERLLSGSLCDLFTQAVFQVPETVREACIVAAVQFRQRWCQSIMIWV